jgi:hypothetical protein
VGAKEPLINRRKRKRERNRTQQPGASKTQWRDSSANEK